MNVSLEGDWKIFSTPSLSNFDRWSVGYSNLFDTLRAIPEKSPATYPHTTSLRNLIMSSL